MIEYQRTVVNDSPADHAGCSAIPELQATRRDSCQTLVGIIIAEYQESFAGFSHGPRSRDDATLACRPGVNYHAGILIKHDSILQ